jgi:hypothetical protein
LKVDGDRFAERAEGWNGLGRCGTVFEADASLSIDMHRFLGFGVGEAGAGRVGRFFDVSGGCDLALMGRKLFL